MIRKFEGCTPEQVRALRDLGMGAAPGAKPIGAFLQQRRVAKFRGVEWHLTLVEWWSIWQESGKWLNRGRRANEYVMCRRGDVGPYAVWNVFIATAADNVSTGTRRKGDLPRGVSQVRPTAFAAYRSFNGSRKYLGCFRTPEQAHAAYVNARLA